MHGRVVIKKVEGREARIDGRIWKDSLSAYRKMKIYGRDKRKGMERRK